MIIRSVIGFLQVREEAALAPCANRQIQQATYWNALTGRAPAPASLAEAATLAGYSRVHRSRVAYRERYGSYPALPAQAAPAAPAVRAASP